MKLLSLHLKRVEYSFLLHPYHDIDITTEQSAHKNKCVEHSLLVLAMPIDKESHRIMFPLVLGKGAVRNRSTKGHKQ